MKLIVRNRWHSISPILGLALLATVAQWAWATDLRARGPDRIENIVVIYLENRSFDNLYGHFPGANGLEDSSKTATQTDSQGQVYATLPPVMSDRTKPPEPDKRFPANLPNAPFLIDRYVPIHEKHADDLVRSYYRQQQQIHGGKMDRFVAVSGSALTMGYHDTSQTALYRYAERYTLADNFFHAAFGGSLLNHLWLVCACTPRWPEAPPELRAQLDAAGRLVKDGEITPDGYVVNTMYTVNTPHPARIAAAHLLPNLTLPTIGDRLDATGLSWAWYSGGWKDALAGKPHARFQFHHQPFAYFAKWADGTAAKSAHLRDETDFLDDLAAGRLPAVSVVKPLGIYNEHPNTSELMAGQEHMAELVRAVRASRQWPHTLIVITYDENGGRWDHVAPPVVDRWGPGVRVPTVIVSPLVKRGHVDHTRYDTTAILKLIETRWGLAPLGTRDAAQVPLTGAF